MKKVSSYLPGIAVSIILAWISVVISRLIPHELISGGVFAMIIGMLLHSFAKKYSITDTGINFASKTLLKASIILMGATLSFAQVFSVGKYSLIVMTFSLAAAFGFGNLFGKLFKMNWKLSNLISAGTGICGGSAIAAISPTIEADDSDVAYAISATFIFDIVMVVLFPIMGRAFMMSDMGYGLWAGTAVNDTSSVVTAGFAFSDAAGRYATIVKLTRTLSIVPVVLIFGFVNERQKIINGINSERVKISIKDIFPWFIFLFIGMVALRTLIDYGVSNSIGKSFVLSIESGISTISKFIMVMALGAIGLKTDFKKVAKSGFMPMLHGFIISEIVVIVSFVVQYFLGQL